MSSVFGQLFDAAVPSRRLGTVVRTAFTPIAIAADAGTIIGMAALSGFLYHWIVYGAHGDIVSFLGVGAATAVIFTLPNMFRGEYALANYFAFKSHGRRSLYLWNVTFLCLLALGFILRVTEVHSRGTIILFYVMGLPAVVLMRYALVSAVVTGGRLGLVTAQRIFLVGGRADIIEFVRRYRHSAQGVHIVGSALIAPPPHGAASSERDRSLQADLTRAIVAARQLRPDSVFVIVPWSDSEVIGRCVDELLALPVELHLGPERILDRFDKVRISKHGGIASLQLTRQPLATYEVVLKRLLDLTISVGALIVLLPFFAVVALAIRLDSRGPIFFLQRRYGFNQRQFRIIKFRTMHVVEDGDVIVQATANDNRVTRVGRWLRRVSLDELPQVFNVILGQMSLVGPRPHALSHNREYEQKISFYARRHNVKPGITGWAQVNGLRGETDTDAKMRRRVEHDMYYIENWSLWLDLRILAMTIVSPSAYRNAH